MEGEVGPSIKEQINENECKYCLEVIPNEKIDSIALRPCNCNNYVHKTCLDNWNLARPKEVNHCEVCNFVYVRSLIRTFDRHAFCFDILKILYVVLAILFIAFCCPFVMFGYGLFDIPPDDSGPRLPMTIIGTLWFYMIYFILVIGCGWRHVADMRVSHIDFCNSSTIVKMATITYYIGISIIIVQLIGLVFGNIILGRPVAFTPRGETFGISLGLIVGFAGVNLLIYFIIRGIRNYVRNNWIKETVVISNNVNNVNNDVV
ncbi:MAG: hypothetical protein Barrevirus25_5 [Barrevirus sp.]|uniref:E3 ubiquitin-protein ligase LAP n=1 Tax=Barrevirus sp. TaxID=2487763 RepID=A0A3G4ZQT8_9VIRU|nr:MAG: hypothetical protein Barrevirus25_5 [Barrevirus sp.]